MLNNIELKKATIDDCYLLYQWANEKTVRNNSFHSNEILYEDHVKWFQSIINSNESDILIMSKGGVPVGQVRLNYSKSSALIGYSIDAEFRGKGYGTLIISLIEQYAKHRGIDKLIGHVKRENVVSQRVFEKNYYKKDTACNVDYLQYTKILI